YVIEDERGATIIDPGMPGPESHKTLIRSLKQCGLPIERVHSVLVTHSHPDHFGGAGRLHAETGCDVVAHDDFVTPFDQAREVFDDDLLVLDDVITEAPAAQEGNSRLRELLFSDGPIPELPPRPTPWGEDGIQLTEIELTHMRAWDDLSKKGLLSLTPTERVADEQVITLGRSEWVVVHTPGHTGDHICLFDPVHGTLLSGDHVLPTITPHISGIAPHPDTLTQYFDALHHVAQIDGVTTVLPAHGLPFGDLPGRVAEIVEHHEDRLELLFKLALELEDAPVREYSRRLFRERSWGPMAESETFAHLEHMRLQGRLSQTRDDLGRLRYKPAA
ncbi:MAG TPA: MBL fold metallo-hydrolase, partial [Microthrixaceae bacterium]|nr:MBL fold metallo-hydrolase [Microthrixaceae bacterium]